MTKIASQKNLQDRLLEALNAGSLAKAIDKFYDETNMLVRDDIRAKYKEELKEAIRPCEAPDGVDESQCWTGTPVLAAFEAMKILSDGNSVTHAEAAIHRFGMDGYAASVTAQIVGFYSPRGKEFKKYWDNRFKTTSACP